MADDINRAEAEIIVEHFKGQPVNQNVLDEFCNLKDFKNISVNDYEDYLFAYGHDRRIDAIMPDIFEVLKKLRNPHELGSESARTKVLEANESLEMEICELLEKHDITYQELKLVTEGLGGLIKRLFDNVYRRTDNLATRELVKAAEAKFGSPITIKAFGKSDRGE